MDFSVISDNLTYFLVGRYPHGPLGGVGLTLYLAAASCALAFAGGTVLALLLGVPWRPVRVAAGAYVHAMRGVPLLMVVFWMYFLLPAIFGHAIPENGTVIAALSAFSSAYMSQIVRAGIDSVPRGQKEAAMATGLGARQAMLYVVLPQGLRNMIPSLVNELVSLIKDTSLAFIVGVSELTHIATQINNRTMVHPAEIFIFVAAVYFAICFSLTAASRWLERRLARSGGVGAH